MSSNKYYFQEKYLEMYFDTDSSIAYVNWLGFANDEKYLHAMDVQLEMVLKERVKLLLCDIRNFKGTSPKAQAYTTKEIIPKLYNGSRLKKIAYVVGESVFANYTLDVIRKEIDQESYLYTNAFTEVDKAIQWLNEEIEVAK